MAPCYAPGRCPTRPPGAGQSCQVDAAYLDENCRSGRLVPNDRHVIYSRTHSRTCVHIERPCNDLSFETSHIFKSNEFFKTKFEYNFVLNAKSPRWDLNRFSQVPQNESRSASCGITNSIRVGREEDEPIMKRLVSVECLAVKSAEEQETTTTRSEADEQRRVEGPK